MGGADQSCEGGVPCWNVDTQAIWERFLAFNLARGNAAVPAGFLLGFMRRWRTSLNGSVKQIADAAPKRVLAPKDLELHRLIAAALSKNREFHASDLRRVIGPATYEARVVDVVRQFGCPTFAAILAVHGKAVIAGEIAR